MSLARTLDASDDDQTIDYSAKRVLSDSDADLMHSGDTSDEVLLPPADDDPALLLFEDAPDVGVLTDEHLAQLNQYGYCVIERVLTPDEARATLTGIEQFIRTLLPGKGLVKPPGVHGICKHEGGHLRVVWEHVRLNPRVQRVFCDYWGCEPSELLTSFDGFRYLPAHRKTQPQYAPQRVLDLSGESWAHYDQTLATAGCDPRTKRPYENLQGSASLSDHTGGGGFLVYPGSHELLPELWRRYQWKDNFYILPKDVLQQIQTDARQFYPAGHPLRSHPVAVPIRPVVVHQPAGSLTLWRNVIHQSVESNSFSVDPSCVAYAAMGPVSRATPRDLQKRAAAFRDNRMTSHWWHTAKLNAKAPRTYGREVEPFGDVRHLVVNTLEELDALGRHGRSMVAGPLQ